MPEATEDTVVDLGVCKHCGKAAETHVLVDTLENGEFDPDGARGGSALAGVDCPGYEPA